MTDASPPRLTVWAVAVLLAAMWFATLGTRDLIRPDEGRYAEIAREMAVTGDWVTPRLNGLKYFEKPPLQYWVTAAAFRAFGAREWTARLWPALAGALTVWVVWRTGRRQFGIRAGDYAGLTAASALWMVANSHLNTLDMGFAFWLTAGIAAFLEAQREGQDRAARHRWMLLAWAACAGAVLSKGLAGLVLPGGAIALYLAASRDWRLLGRLHLATGLVVVAAICAPWFVAVSAANPEFPEFFFVREHLQRYLTPVHRRVEPVWYFVPLLIAGALPWLGAMGQALWRPWRLDRGGVFRPRLFLFCWCLFVFGFFSASSSKLPSYILPVFPALAWLAGERLAATPPEKLAWHALPLILIGPVAVWVGIHLERYANERTTAAMYQAYEPWVIVAGLVALAGGAVAVHWARRGEGGRAVVTLALTSLAAWQLALTGHQALSASFSGAQFARKLDGRVSAQCPFYSVRAYDQTLPFYLGRTLTLVDFEDEMAFGLEREPALGIPSFADFAARWQAAECAYAFLEPATLADFDAAALPYHVLARDTRRVAVSRHAGVPATRP